MITFTYKNYKRITINLFLKNKGYSDNNIFYLIKNKNVLDNDEVVKDKNHLLKFNHTIKVILNEEENNLIKCDSKLDILYEDNYLLIVNKPYGIEVEPSMNNNETTLANIVSNYYELKGIKSKIHLVNRLDKLTSGIIILAKNQYIHNLFKKVKITKKYKALVMGKTNSRGCIKVNIAKKEDSIERYVDDSGKLSITKYKLLSYKDNESLVDIKLITGRTHQIRVSFAHINNPLISDPLYGKTIIGKDMFLKAYYIKFIHPVNKKVVKISI